MDLRFRDTRRFQELEPGEWAWVVHGGWRGTPARKVPAVCCPTCSSLFSLANHAVSAGVASPSVVCPWRPCTFHTFVRLVGGPW